MANTKTEKTEIEPATTAAVATVGNQLTIDAEDIDIPRLNVVQKMSTGDFDHGSLIIDKTHEILPRETKGH